MSKVIIEHEKPKRCKDCVWYQADSWFGGSCVISKEENGWNKTIGADEEYNVQKWCPLRPKNDVIPIDWLRERASRMLDFGEGVERIIKEWQDEQSK